MADKLDVGDIDEATETWIKEQEDLIHEGEALVKQASDEALEYVKDAIENLNDKQWRKMVMATQAIEMGVGVAIADHVVPMIYDDMSKSLHKKLKINKDTARALQHIYIGRLIKNTRKALNGRTK